MSDSFEKFEITTGASFFYMGGEKLAMLTDITLCSPVSGTALQHAAEAVLKRYPCFAVRLAVSDEGDRYILVKNHAPFTVSERPGYTDLDSGDANGYLFSVSWFDRHIFISVFHGLTDGGGILKLSKALLCAYFEYLEGRVFSCGGDINIHAAPSPEDYLDPFETLSSAGDVFTVRKKPGFTFSPELVDDKSVRVYNFSISEKAIVDYAKRDEGSVSGLISLALARSIDIIERQDKITINIACPMDVRGMLGCGSTLRNCTKSARYEYSPKFRSQKPETQLSLLKGQMMIQSSAEYQLPRYLQDREDFLELMKTPSIEDKKAFFASGAVKGDPIVSYLGRVDLGELNDKVEDFIVYSRVCGVCGMQTVCLCFKGQCRICTSYNLKDDKYMRIFANEMESFSIQRTPLVQIDYDSPAERKELKRRMVSKAFSFTADGSEIHCLSYSVPHRPVKTAVLSFHGFSSSKNTSSGVALADALLAKNPDCTVIYFDLPCHGDDTCEKLTVEGCLRYTTLVRNYVHDTMGIRDICLYGTSFGGYLALLCASRRPEDYRRIVLRCPGVELISAFRKNILAPGEFERIQNGEKLPAGLGTKLEITKTFFDEIEANPLSDCDFSPVRDKLLIIQGTADEVVSCEAVKAFAERNSIPVILVPGADHRFLDKDKMSFAMQQLISFMGL